MVFGTRFIPSYDQLLDKDFIFNAPNPNVSVRVGRYYFGAGALEASDFGLVHVVIHGGYAIEIGAVIYFDLTVVPTNYYFVIADNES